MAYDSTLIRALAALETRDGEATIKGPNGEDSHNLFNIKDFSGNGYRALDKAEGSRDAYRVYASRAESERDLINLLSRRYPKAHAALSTGDAEAFARGLKEGGYATDPNYESKLLSVVKRVRGDKGAAMQELASDDSPEAAAILAGRPKDRSAASAVAAAQAQLAGMDALRQAQDPDEAFRAEAEREKEAQLALDTGVGDAFRAAIADPRVMSYDLLDKLTGESDLGPDNLGWSWADNRAAMTKGMSDDERAYMDEWAVKGPQYAERARAQVEVMRGHDKVYGRAGALATFAGSLGAGAIDIPSWIVGLGLGKAASLVKSSGRAALAASAGEQVGGQLLVEAMNDASGRTSTAADYMAATAFATLPFALTARGTYRGAAEAAIETTARRWAEQIDPLHFQRKGEPAELTAAKQVEQIRADFERPPADTSDKVMAPDLLRQIEDDFDAAKRTTPDTEPNDRVRIPDPERPLPVPEVKEPVEPIPVGEVTEVTPEVFDFPEIQDITLKTPEDKAAALLDDLEAKHKAGQYDDSTSRIAALMMEDGFDYSALSKATADRLDRVMTEATNGMEEAGPRDLTRPHYWGTANGEPINVGWSFDGLQRQMADDTRKRDATVTKKSATLRDFLAAYTRAGNTNDNGQARVAQHILDRLKDDPALDRVTVNIHRSMKTGLSGYDGTIAVPANSVGAGAVPKSLDDTIKAMNAWAYQTGLHEAMHVLTQVQIEAVKATPHKVSPAVRAAVGTLTSVVERLRERTPGWEKATNGVGYAAKNEHELLAMFFDSPEVQRELSRMPARKEFGGRLSSAFNEVLDAIKKMLRLDLVEQKVGLLTQPTARDEVAWAIDVLLDRRGGGAITADGVQLPGWPAVTANVLAQAAGTLDLTPVAAPTNPLKVSAAKKAFAAGLFQHALDFVKRNPIDPAKLKVITEKIGSKSDGLVIAASKNPIMQMVASLVTETTTGAAGRKPTAAIRKALVEQKLIGNMVIDFEAHFDSWRATNKLPWWEDLTRVEGRLKFNRAVYEEILRRRNGQPSSNDAAIRGAADAAEGMFTRALAEQKRANTLGSGNLPEHSRGYVPQALDGRKLANATEADIKELADHLTQHWSNALGWDQKFASEFSLYYINRARARAMNTKGLELAAEASDSVHTVRETLDAMKDTATDPNAVSAILKAKAALSEKGLGQTRARLDVALDTTLPSGKKVLDFYDDNVMGLARRYANRTAGTVALTDAGIHGSVGVRYLRDAITETAQVEGAAVTKDELDAFDRVMTELLGQPVAGEVVSRHASNLRLFVGLQRLGSLAFTQASETMNMLHHLGLSATLKGIASLPRMMGEVGRIKRGAPAGNHILTSLELWSGDIGSEHYKMVMPLDPPDGRVGTYAEDPGLVSRLVGAASHLQQKVSFFRGIMAAQHRMVAEQITMRAAALIRDAEVDPTGKLTLKGGNIEALRDMGFTDELIGALHANLSRIAQWDPQGRMTAFDITQAPNPVAAEAFVQAVHRGVTQIIQGTFVGEKTKWMHNDYLKLLAQLRTFGVTGAEKQWRRTALIHGGGARGYAYVSGLLIAQSALALPLHLARVQLNAAGREDRDAFIEKNLSPYALVRSVMNYGSLSGLMGDALDITAGFAGGWSSDVQDIVGGRQGGATSAISNAIPVVGSADQLARTLTGNNSLANSLKQLPGSNLPFVIPAINLMRQP